MAKQQGALPTDGPSVLQGVWHTCLCLKKGVWYTGYPRWGACGENDDNLRNEQIWEYSMFKQTHLDTNA